MGISTTRPRRRNKADSDPHNPRRLKARYSVSIDGGPPSSIDLETKEFSAEWAENVLHATAIGKTEQPITAGKHTLSLSPLDPGMVFDKIVIDIRH